MGINRYRWNSKPLSQYDIRHLAPDTRQLYQLLNRIGDLTLVFIFNLLRQCHQFLCLRSVKSHWIDYSGYLSRTQSGKRMSIRRTHAQPPHRF
jgi:hypothetical protein